MSVATITHTFTANTAAQASQVNTDFADLVTFLNNSVIHRDGSKVMSGHLTLLAGTDPTDGNHAARKLYVDSIGGSRSAQRLFPAAGGTVNITNSVSNSVVDTNNPSGGVFTLTGFVKQRTATRLIIATSYNGITAFAGTGRIAGWVRINSVDYECCRAIIQNGTSVGVSGSIEIGTSVVPAGTYTITHRTLQVAGSATIVHGDQSSLGLHVIETL